MNAEIYILNFIEKNYKFEFNFNDIIIVTSYDDSQLNRDRFVSEINNIFGGDFSAVASNWYHEKFNLEFKSLNEYLDKYKIILGRDKWLILDVYDNELSVTKMEADLGMKYSQKLLSKIVSEWYTYQVIKETEQIMKINF